MTRWYRAYEGTVTDPKLGEVALVAGCSRSVAIAAWHCILESCAVANDGGNFDATLRRVAVILGEPLQIIEAIFSELENLKMIQGSSVTSWAKRQFESDSSTERSKKHRENKAKENATELQRCATPPDTETETDTENNRDANASLVNVAVDPSIKLSREKDEAKAALRRLGEQWNALAANLKLPQIDEIPPGSTRERSALARIREARDFDAIFAKIRGSPYLRGEVNGFRCTFNWIVNPTNILKVLEGNYDNEVRKAPVHPYPQR